jgi:hypothetical protein
MDAKLLKEPRDLIMDIKTRIMRSQPEGLAQEIDRAEALIKDAAVKANAAANDPGVTSLLQGMADCRKELAKLNARLPPKAVATATAPVPAPAPAAPAPIAAPAISGAEPDKDALFNVHKANFQKVQDFFKKYNRTLGGGDWKEATEEVIKMTPELAGMAALAAQVLNAYQDGLGDLNEFERANQEAKSLNLAWKIKQLPGQVESAQARREELKSSVIGELDKDMAELQTAQNNASIEQISGRVNQNLAKLEQLAAQDPKLAQIKSALEATAQAAQGAIQGARAGARMSAERYAGPDKAQLQAELGRIYEAANRGEKVLRVIVMSPDWVDNEIQETLEKNGQMFLVKKPVQDLQAQIAVQAGDKCRGFAIGFRRDIVNGVPGPIEYHGIGESFEILRENIAG